MPVGAGSNQKPAAELVASLALAVNPEAPSTYTVTVRRGPRRRPFREQGVIWVASVEAFAHDFDGDTGVDEFGGVGVAQLVNLDIHSDCGAVLLQSITRRGVGSVRTGRRFRTTADRSTSIGTDLRGRPAQIASSTR